MTMAQRVASRYLAAASGEAPIEEMVEAAERKLSAIAREVEVRVEDEGGKSMLVCSCRPKSVPMALEYAKHEGYSEAQVEKITAKAIAEVGAALKAAMGPFRTWVKEIETPFWNEKDYFSAYIVLNAGSASTPVEDIAEAVNRDIKSGLSEAGRAGCYPYGGTTNLGIYFTPTGALDAKELKKALALFKKGVTDVLRAHKKWVKKVNPPKYTEHDKTFRVEVNLK